jgi:ATP-binding cassette subfamily B protein
MDCGPATLKSLFEGFGVSLSYGRIREACQTDVDGTSIDTIEDIAVELGLQAEQTILPIDHMLLPQARALPAIVVTALPDGSNHFVVAWRRHGRFVQVMDPATGRRWPVCETFLKEVYSHVHPVPALSWRRWAGSEEFIAPLASRLRYLGVAPATTHRLIETALSDESWTSVACLDAAVRMIQSLIASRGLRPGRRAARLLEAFFNRAIKHRDELYSIIPLIYWTVTPAGRASDGREYLNIKGAVIVRVRKEIDLGRAAAGQNTESPPRKIPVELVAALREAPARPSRELFRLLRQDGLGTMLAITLAILIVSGGLVFEALLLRSLFDIGRTLGLASQRLEAMAVLIVYGLALLLLDLSVTERLQHLGRSLETRLRIAILEKLPRLPDRYFHSRLTSDMTERAHSLYAIRLLPALASQVIRSVFGLLLTTVAIVWLDPRSAPLAIAIVLVSIALPALSQPFLAERDLRVRTHAGALMRFYLDTLLGLIPIRAHGGQRAIRREHEALLVEWARSGFGLQRRLVGVEAVQAIVNLALVSSILLSYFGRSGEGGTTLLLIYWSLSLPALGQQVFLTLQQYPTYRNITLRILEPLGAPEEPQAAHRTAHASYALGLKREAKAVSIRFEDVSVRATGHFILEGINLEVKAGSHVAIVGASGAGKSSLVGLLLGWHRPASGRIIVDCETLDGDMLKELRRQTAWVDPMIQLWNRSLMDNLLYGVHGPADFSLSKILELSRLSDTLMGLPEGLQTSLGEGGALVSGGEGQRVRLARGMLRPGVRLVILDEPFRGLDRPRRRELLSNSRDLWKDATLFCITHDVGETLDFERVIVLERGRIVEDGAPADLLKKLDSSYRAIIEAEKAARDLWRDPIWRRLKLEKGRLLGGTE